MLQKDLQTLGFTKNLATIYLALFDLGTTKAGDIVKKTGLHRHLVYTGLETLEQKNLISKSERRGVALYQTLDPARLLNELQERENLANGIIEALKTKRTPQTQEVIVHEGREEMQRLYLQIYRTLNASDTLYIISLSSNWFNVMGNEVVERLIAFQNKQGFTIKGVGDVIDKNEITYKNKTSGLSHMKIVPGTGSPTSETLILSDRIIINEFVEPFTSVEILNANIVKNYRTYFELLWSQETKTYSGWEAIQRLFWNELVSDSKANDQSYVIGAGYGKSGADPEVIKLFLHHNKHLIKHKITKNALFYERHRERFTREIREAGDPLFNLVKVRYLPDEFYSPVEIHIFDTRATVSYFGENPVSTLYENKEIIAGFKNQFKLLWSIAKD